ncbi:wd domain-containing protein [Ophiostoma piceae UAMH 11346]|uniref:Wd domain-containing protein n=1 Tax=Ophiostoma piceae (strain UAMH 11346) TaxID=1262450 RepID=S3CRP7_OPHP1|nr:wd domain-containing protein [Ophiostoma piceae UAMH 11346]
MDFPAYVTSSGGPPLPIRTRSQSPARNLHDLDGTPSPVGSGPPSPTDSGYASTLTTPQKRPSSSDDYEARTCYTLDGAGRDYFEDLVSDTDKLPRTVVLTPEQRPLARPDKKIFKAQTVRKPRRALPRPEDANTSDLLHHRQALNTLLGPYLSKNKAGHVSSSLRRPDRFVHPRERLDPRLTIRDRHCLARAPEALSPIERVFRNNVVSRDVFAKYPRNKYCPMPTNADLRQRELHRLGHPTQTQARTTLGTQSEATAVTHTPISGSVWSAGTMPPVSGSVDNGRGQFVQSHTSAPVFVSDFLTRHHTQVKDQNKHKGRMCVALGLDRTARLLNCNVEPDRSRQRVLPHHPLRAEKKTVWDGATWVNNSLGDRERNRADRKQPQRNLEVYRSLSAPEIRDDFYITPIAFCLTTGTMAVALGDELLTWMDGDECATYVNGSTRKDVHLTSLAFSCAEGGRSILAFGRSNGLFGLMALSDANHARMVVQEQLAISCLSWRPKCTMRPSRNPKRKGQLVWTEDLLVGIENGVTLYYIVEWPSKEQVEQDGWGGDISLAARIKVSKQQICGMAWSPDGSFFATGSNDDVCCIFEVDEVFRADMYSIGDLKPIPARSVTQVVARSKPKAPAQPATPGPRTSATPAPPARASRASTTHTTDPSITSESKPVAELDDGSEVWELTSKYSVARLIRDGDEYCFWEHGGAVKAIAFCPWQKGLVATGGGLTDRCIHFFHTTSGSALATIFVSAQVTGLIWSTTRREIAATFGHGSSSHNTRVAVYTWPECKQVASATWPDRRRALSSIACVPKPPVPQRVQKKTGKVVDELELSRARRPHPEDIVIDNDDDDNDDDNDDATAEEAEQAKDQARGGRNPAPALANQADDSTGTHGRHEAAVQPKNSLPEERELHDGIIAVASSEGLLKFYEIWPQGGRAATGGYAGILGGSDILEDIEGIQKEGDIIR